MSVQMGKIERKIRDILKATGLPWDMIPARKHWLLYLDGQMVGVLSRGLGGGEADAGTRHIESHIKRFVKQHADGRVHAQPGARDRKGR